VKVRDPIELSFGVMSAGPLRHWCIRWGPDAPRGWEVSKGFSGPLV